SSAPRRTSTPPYRTASTALLVRRHQAWQATHRLAVVQPPSPLLPSTGVVDQRVGCLLRVRSTVCWPSRSPDLLQHPLTRSSAARERKAQASPGVRPRIHGML